MKKLRLFTPLAMAALLLLLSGCAPPPVVQREAYVFGTRVELLLAIDPAEAGTPRAEAAMASVLAEFDRLHRTYHAWQPSELTALNAELAAGRAPRISPEFASFIREAAQLAQAGEYLFDPGIGGLVALWGFHGETYASAPPSPAARAAWLQTAPSIAALTLDENKAGESDEPDRIPLRSSNPAVMLDFGGYLKGVALDRAAALLRAQGIDNALINIGGNLMALGSRHGHPWRVGIQHPRRNGPLATLELADGEALGTSGDYQRYFEYAGQRYNHLLDPRSGAPVQHTQSLTVLTGPGPAPASALPAVRAGARSDAASKPLFIAGAGAWPRLARQLGVQGVLRVAADGQIEVTAELARRLRFDAPAPRPEALHIIDLPDGQGRMR